MEKFEQKTIFDFLNQEKQNNRNYKIINDSMLNLDKHIENESIDAIITDPPYELNFMNKSWDNTGIAFQKETWEKCFNALKSGGYLLAFGGSRTYHRICCAIEDAGFEIRDCIMWLYGSGFPKSMDISKQIDKRGGNNTKFLCDLIKEKREEKKLSQKQLDELMGTNGMVNWWEKGERGITPVQFNKLCEILELPFKNIAEVEREVIGRKEKQMSGWNMDGTTKFVDRDITLPSTDLAKQWAGWGTCLKPAFEPIIVARKPFKGSLVDNVLEYGVGGLNIDECRVGNEVISIHNAPKGTFAGGEYGRGSDTSSYRDSQGRFPANLILTYDENDFAEVCGGFPNEKGNSASRYFYCAKASKKDRDEGLDEFENTIVNDGRNKPIDNAFQRGETPRKNIHPTVKPTELMQYLVRLVAPKGATILDVFMGSGSTGKAVMYENKERDANYNFIGFELNEEYCKIAEARIEYVIKNK